MDELIIGHILDTAPNLYNVLEHAEASTAAVTKCGRRALGG